MTVYCDTSLLISFFNEDDINHKAARVEVGKRAAQNFVVCDVHLLELPAAVRAATHRANSRMPPHMARRIINRFDRAVNGDLFIRKTVNMTDSAAMARSLGDAHGWKNRHTAFDLWHLAAAWSLSAGAFLTFDKRQASLARLIGLAA